MDDRFADRMGELGEIDGETLTSRWETVVSIAKEASSGEKAKLVLFACSEPISRDEDVWFWKPFRDSESTFRIEDSVELHARLAEAAVSYLISGEDALVAMLVCLAVMSGQAPVHPELAEEAQLATIESSPTLRRFQAPKPVWNKQAQAKLNPETGPDLAVASTSLGTLGISTQSALAELTLQLGAVTAWARAAERRFGNEQMMVQWLLGGVRRNDQVPWPSLPAATVAIDAATDLANFIDGAPQARHEAILSQVLSVAGVVDDAISSAASEVSNVFRPASDAALRTLCPISAALATKGELPAVNAYSLAQRLLWEIKASAAWES